jgi:hypothetical protein
MSLSTLKPKWMLDVDGVINSFHHQQQFKKVMVPADGYEWPIRYNPVLIERIVAISDRVDIVWNTTWCEYAPLELAPRLGLPDFPYSPDCDDEKELHSAGLGWWKHNRVLAAVAEGLKVVWTDDDIPNELIVNNEDILTIRPNPLTGLTLREMDTIERFVDE